MMRRQLAMAMEALCAKLHDETERLKQNMRALEDEYKTFREKAPVDVDKRMDDYLDRICLHNGQLYDMQEAITKLDNNQQAMNNVLHEMNANMSAIIETLRSNGMNPKVTLQHRLPLSDIQNDLSKPWPSEPVQKKNIRTIHNQW